MRNKGIKFYGLIWLFQSLVVAYITQIIFKNMTVKKHQF